MSPLAPAPWLTIGNATGQLAIGQTVSVLLGVNPAVPAKLNGGYCVTTSAGNQPWA